MPISQEVQKEIAFIWFGSAIPSRCEEPFYRDYFTNIVKAKQVNPNYSISLYIDSSIITPDELSRMNKDCQQQTINLMDIVNHPTIESWFGYSLLRDINKKGHKENNRNYFANSSDLLRIMLMVYKGGYYFDCDCTCFPDLNKTNSSPSHGFWQARDPHLSESEISRPVLLPYCFQASIQYHPVFILALADIIYRYQHNWSLFFNIDSSDPLIHASHIDQINAVVGLTGHAVFHGIRMWLKQLDKHWHYYVNESPQTILFPESNNIRHEGSRSYVYRLGTDTKRRSTQNNVAGIEGLQVISIVNKDNEETDLILHSHYSQIYSILPEELQSYLIPPPINNNQKINNSTVALASPHGYLGSFFSVPNTNSQFKLEGLTDKLDQQINGV